jgi:RNA recognition motif-containing protein
MPATYGVIAPRRHYNYDEGTARAFPVKANAVTYSPQYQHQEAQFALPYCGHDEYPTYYADCSLASGELSYRSEYVVTEPRKLHVSPFPQQARADEVKSWVRRKVDKTKIESMEIPKNSNSRYLRGYVLVVFDSVASANTAIDQLSKARFQGRRVIARPTSEGAVEEPSGSYEASSQVELKSDEGHIPTGPSRNKSNDDRKNEKSQRPKNKESKSTDVEKKRVSEKKSSSSKTASGSHTDRKSSSKKASVDEKIPRNDLGPVIVDGTCHRQDKH